MRNVASGTHQDDDSLRIRRANVIEKMILASRPRREFVHRGLGDSSAASVKWIHCFAPLEIRVGILSRPAENRFIGIQCASPMFRDKFVID